MVLVPLGCNGFLVLEVIIRHGIGSINCVVRWYAPDEIRARETITPCFGTPIHPVWLRCENLKDTEYSCVSAPCQTGASTPQTHGLNYFASSKLTTAAEVDETYVGGVGVGTRGRGALKKSIVAIGAEIRGRGPGRIRMSVIPDVSATSLNEFILDNVQKGVEIHTDGWSGYTDVEALGYRHVVTNISANGDPAHVVMPRVHLIASLLDRWWLGIHQGAIRPSHLEYYLDEFTFRFNRRSSKKRGLLFYRLMQQAVNCTPVTRQMIIGGRHEHLVNG